VNTFLISSCGQLTGGGCPAWGLGEVLTTPHHKKITKLRIIQKSLRPGRILWYNLSNGKGI
jgi:hypothetical protein